MQMFLPSLFILLVSAIIILGVIPRITPFYIFIIIVIFFVISVYSHYMMFRHEYNINVWRDTFAKSMPVVIGVGIAIGLLVASLNLFTNIKIVPPSFKIFEPKQESLVKGYSNVPIEKIIELEKQL